MQIGEVQSGRTYNVTFDDGAFGTARLGPEADSVPPSVPTGLSATVVSSFEADLAWSASTHDVGLVGYDVFRDGTLIAGLGSMLTYAVSGTTPGTHSYAVRARDGSSLAGHEQLWCSNLLQHSRRAVTTEGPNRPQTDRRHV